MNTQEIQDLLKRINEEPSVLFLGQNYLASDPKIGYIQKLKEVLGIEDEKIHCFSSLYSRVEECCDEPGNAPKAIQRIVEAMRKTAASCSKINWLKKLLHFRWNLVYTSSVDGIICQNYSADRINDQRAVYRAEYAQKNRPHLVELFGSCYDSEDATSFIPLTSKAVRRQNLTRLDYIKNQIINQYGILIIDGWNSSDWLRSKDLVGMILNLNPRSVYIFGISSGDLLESIEDVDDREDLKQELKNECISVEEKPFVSVLLENDCLGNKENDDEELLASYSSYSLTFQDGQRILIPKKNLRELDSRIQLIHDDLVPLVHTDDVDRGIAFTSFLTQGADVKWSLFSDRYDFYFKRDVDKELLDDIRKQLKKNSNKRKPIILEGVSSSGKTTTLVHLALHLRHLVHKPAVVFFISEEPEDKEWKETLHYLIRNSILNKQFQNHQYLNDVVLICDMNNRDYAELQSAFAECNALIIGSSYLRHDSREEHVYLLDSVLSEPEEEELKRVLNSVNPRYFCDFSSIRKYSKKTDNKADKSSPCIFELLESFARFIGDRTWREVTMNQRSRLAKESSYTEDETGKAFFETRDFFLENGIGAALIQKIRDEYGEDSKYEVYVDQIRKINKYVAIAGQYGIFLPFSLLLKTLRGDASNSNYQVEVRFIRDVLALDSLLEFNADQNTGCINVRFRNPKEAYQYLCYQQGDEEKRKGLEIDLLCEMIDICDWNEDYGNEAQRIISLIRSYGPNSFGKPFEDNYKAKSEYVDYWHRIVVELENNAIDSNSEALLVYCHFLREEADKKSGTNKYEDLFRKVNDANQILEEYIEKHQERISDDYKMARMEGEMCSNLNFLMKYSEYEGQLETFDNDFSAFYRHFSAAVRCYLKSGKGYTTSNLYLDIWLNAVQNYRNSKQAESDSASENTKRYYHELMNKSLGFIDQFFAPEGSETNYTPLLKKIKKVFDFFKNNNLRKIEQQLDNADNDSMMYMKMMEPFLSNISDNDMTREYQVTVFMNELAGKFISKDDLKKYKEATVEAAQKTVSLFDENGYAGKAKKYRSYRCFYLYLKAKWLLYTGNLLLEEKQRPRLSKEKWQEIKEICDAYLSCFDNPYDTPLIKPAVLLLFAAYNWMFCSSIDYRNYIQLPFERCSKLMHSESIVARIGMCDETGKLYTFAADIVVEGRTTATVRKELRKDNSVLPSDRRELYISELTCSQIFKGHSPRRLTANEQPAVHIWFNGKGAQISLASEAGKEETEQ